jgi:hypothetical protein
MLDMQRQNCSGRHQRGRLQHSLQRGFVSMCISFSSLKMQRSHHTVRSSLQRSRCPSATVLRSKHPTLPCFKEDANNSIAPTRPRRLESRQRNTIAAIESRGLIVLSIDPTVYRYPDMNAYNNKSEFIISIPRTTRPSCLISDRMRAISTFLCPNHFVPQTKLRY